MAATTHVPPRRRLRGHIRTTSGATRTVVAAFGAVTALAGVEHGVGEILQGPVATPGVSFASWPDTAAFEILSGEPAMTVVPNLLVTGILAVVAALALGIWSVGYARHRHGGVVLVGLSIVLLLVGGGFGPPLVGIILGVGLVRQAVRSPRRWGRARQALGRRWRWPLAVGVAGFLGLVPGTVVLSGFFGVESAALVVGLSAAAFGGLLLALSAALAHDEPAA